MRKVKDYLQIKQEFMYNIQSEYDLFKSTMLLKTSAEIYDSCNTIHFYECIYEYFQYNENIDREFMKHMYHRKNIISEIQRIYYKNEYLTIDTWEGIDEIISCMIDE